MPDPLRSIVYPAGLRGSAALIGGGLGAAVGLAASTTAYALGLQREVGFPASLRLWKLGLPEAVAAVIVVAGALLGVLAAWLLGHYMAARGTDEAETEDAAVGLTDATSLRWWDALLTGLPVAAILMTFPGWLRPHEALGVAALGLVVGLGSRRAPRFPEVRDDRLPFDDPEIERLLKDAGGEAGGSREFRWLFKDPSTGSEDEFRFRIPFSADRLAAAREKEHAVASTHDYRRFVQEDLLCQEVVLVAAELRRLNSERGFPQFLQVGNVLAFQRQFRYVHDGADEVTEGHAEYPRYPIETLGDGRGDCEDFAILAAALLHLLGLDVVLIRIGWKEGEPGHVAVGVAGGEDFPPEFRFYTTPEGRRYYYCEATPPSGDTPDWDWHIGHLPFEDPSQVTLVPITQPLA